LPGEIFEVLGKASVSAEPGKGVLDHPAAGSEAEGLRAADSAAGSRSAANASKYRMAFIAARMSVLRGMAARPPA
jgi:hypothetical protein